ncbi:MAG: tyrosine--tRNA ligase [Phycisphaerales bacterium]
MTHDFLAELRWRGLLHQCTDEAGLAAHLASGRRRAYVGFDPTADSLTIGNLVPIMLLRHFQRAGHRPVVLMGGGTGLIGDPSGKSAERTLQTREQVDANVNAQRVIFEGLLDFDGPTGATIVNNADWLLKLGYIEMLRDVGKHFSVNMMMQKDSVRERLHSREQGISYTEFSYMILQSYDFLHLLRDRGIAMQMGGSDQWGNIVAGADLIRRVERKETFGLTAPLVTKADGGKFGKSEAGAIWLTRERTSPYAYYQFWMNADDADVGRFLRIFTLLDRAAIEALEAEHAQAPHQRAAQKALAREATLLLHGEAGLREAEATTSALFTGEVKALSEQQLRDAFAGAPSSVHAAASLGAGVPLLDVLAETTLVKSRREAKEFLASGAVSVNGEKAAPDRTLTTADLLAGGVILLRRGKKQWHLARWA